MINGIGGSYMSSMSYMQTQPTGTKPDPAKLFDEIDADKSGGISQTELESLAEGVSGQTGQTIDTENAVSSYDADGDGELSGEELRSFMEATMQQGLGMLRMPGGPGQGGPGSLFDALDADASAGISATELEEWAANMAAETGNTIDTTDAIATYDEDGDGELSGSELESFLDASGVKPPAPGGVQTAQTEDADSVIDQYDTDGDGVLSSSELQAYLDDTATANESVTGMGSLARQAMSAYVSNFGNSSRSDLLEGFLTNFGGNANLYSSIDFPI